MVETNIVALQQEIVKLLRQQTALAKFGSFAFREPNLQAILEEAARICAGCLNVPYGKICMYRRESNDLLIVAGYGWNANVVGHVVSPADESSPQGRAFVTGQPVIISDLRDTNGVPVPPFYADHGIISTIDVLIKGNSEPFGVLEIDSPEQHTYDAHDVDFLTGFANVLSEAVSTSTRTDVLRKAIAQMKELVAEKDRLLAEKKVLTTELHHRVRNNLQLVYGMLTNQLEDIDKGVLDKDAMLAIARRVMTLAKVYDHLLGSGMDRAIDFGKYLESLCGSLAELQDLSQTRVQLSCDSETVVLDLDTATALGIIVAELVSNSYDHAFPLGDGLIKVSLHYRAGADFATLQIGDDGIGITGEAKSTRHGLMLIRRLVGQVRGTVDLHSVGGTNWKISLPVDHAANRSI